MKISMVVASAVAVAAVTPSVAYGDVIIGTPEDDWLAGTMSNDHINGGAGDDTVIGRGGDDQLSGHQGEDYLRGDDGGTLWPAAGAMTSCSAWQVPTPCAGVPEAISCGGGRAPTDSRDKRALTRYWRIQATTSCLGAMATTP
jgi:Ca2+-binding RTX toxin-like protein